MSTTLLGAVEPPDGAWHPHREPGDWWSVRLMRGEYGTVLPLRFPSQESAQEFLDSVDGPSPATPDGV